LLGKSTLGMNLRQPDEMIEKRGKKKQFSRDMLPKNIPRFPMQTNAQQRSHSTCIMLWINCYDE
jgi:hypothetical protein